MQQSHASSALHQHVCAYALPRAAFPSRKVGSASEDQSRNARLDRYDTSLAKLIWTLTPRADDPCWHPVRRDEVERPDLPGRTTVKLW